MLGINLLLKRILPFTTLICFICYGLTLIFKIEGLTYLSEQTINNTTIWTFNFQQYVRNLSTEMLEKAVSDPIDTKTFAKIVETWKQIWQDGYDLGDIFYTIINGFIMLIDAFLTIINLIIVILRLIIAILLLGISFIGINITNPNSQILKALKDIVDSLTIPLVQPYI